MRFYNHNCGAALVFVAGCLWGSIGLFIRLMSDAGASAATISFLRMAFAFVILAIVTVARSGISFPVDEHGLDPATFPAGGRPALIIVSPARQFPTGAITCP